MLLASTVCFIAVHGGPADHFATFADELSKRGIQVEVYGSGPALQKFQARGVKHLHTFDSADKDSAAHLAGQVTGYDIVITDLGDYFDVELHLALKEQKTKALCCAYYDNPEAFVPGGYSEVAAKVMKLADKVLFANAHLPKAFDTLSDEQKVGIGFYPTSFAQDVLQLRASQASCYRDKLFADHGLEERDQEVLVYMGGNNEAYFNKALPAFLSFLSHLTSTQDLSSKVIVFQQHPGAKAKGIDTALIKNWQAEHMGPNTPTLILSPYSSLESTVFADKVLYYQTSMAPQFVLAGLPTVQVGHAMYEDLLVREGLCMTATSADELYAALCQSSHTVLDLTRVEAGLGIYSDWADRLECVIREKAHMDEVE